MRGLLALLCIYKSFSFIKNKTVSALTGSFNRSVASEKAENDDGLDEDLVDKDKEEKDFTINGVKDL